MPIEVATIEYQQRASSSEKNQLSTVNVHKMRESIKPTTNVPTTPNNSAKKSITLPSKKSKLTLSNTFKSRIPAENLQPK